MSNIEKFLKNIIPQNIKYKNTNLTYQQILQKETNRLKNILQRHLEDYYKSYSPIAYERGQYGGNLRKALSVEDICTLSSNGMTITMELKINENAIHNSIINKSKSNAFWLMNDGWRVKKNTRFKNIYRFGHYEGAHFVEHAIEEFDKNNKYGIKVEVVRPLLYY